MQKILRDRHTQTLVTHNTNKSLIVGSQNTSRLLLYYDFLFLYLSLSIACQVS